MSSFNQNVIRHKIGLLNLAAELGNVAKALQANAEAIASVAHALEQQGGDRAAALKVAEQYVAAFGQIARQGTTVVIPSNLADLAGLVQGALSVLPKNRQIPARAEGTAGKFRQSANLVFCFGKTPIYPPCATMMRTDGRQAADCVWVCLPPASRRRRARAGTVCVCLMHGFGSAPKKSTITPPDPIRG